MKILILILIALMLSACIPYKNRADQWIYTSSGQEWIYTPTGQAWLKTSDGIDYTRLKDAKAAKKRQEQNLEIACLSSGGNSYAFGICYRPAVKSPSFTCYTLGNTTTCN